MDFGFNREGDLVRQATRAFQSEQLMSKCTKTITACRVRDTECGNSGCGATRAVELEYL